MAKGSPGVFAERLRTQAQSAAHAHGGRLDWGKRMSDNVAYALLFYTGLQIVVTMTAFHTGHGSLLPYFALVVLGVAILPACKLFEGRWLEMSEQDRADPALRGVYRREQLALWVSALGIPFGLTGLFKLVAPLF